MKILRMLLLFAALAPFAVFAGEVSLSCTLPTLNEDGTALTDLEGVRFYEASVTGGPYMLVQDNSPALCSAFFTRGAGTYYYVGTAYNAAGVESVYSNEASKTIFGSALLPPTGLTVQAGQLTAYMLSVTTNVGVLGPVGTVPEGTACDTSMGFNGMYVVPVEKVDWAGSLRTILVFAECA